MKKRVLLLLVLILLLLLIGCINNNPLDLIKEIPEVQAILAQNPGASIKVAYLDQDYVSKNIDGIRVDCGAQMGEVPYYFVSIDDSNSNVKIYTDETAKRVLCIIKPANLAGNNATANSSLNNNADVFDQESDLEQQFSDIVCSTLPNDAVHLDNDYVAVLIPARLDSELKKIGDSISFDAPE